MWPISSAPTCTYQTLVALSDAVVDRLRRRCRSSPSRPERVGAQVGDRLRPGRRAARSSAPRRRPARSAPACGRSGRPARSRRAGGRRCASPRCRTVQRRRSQHDGDEPDRVRSLERPLRAEPRSRNTVWRSGESDVHAGPARSRRSSWCRSSCTAGPRARERCRAAAPPQRRAPRTSSPSRPVQRRQPREQAEVDAERVGVRVPRADPVHRSCRRAARPRRPSPSRRGCDGSSLLP